jgi:hypothetical protein
LSALSAEAEAKLASIHVELAGLTGISSADWADFLSCSPEQQMAIAQGFRDMNWTTRDDVFGKVLAVLVVAGNIAGAVSGVAGAVSAVQALAKTL